MERTHECNMVPEINIMNEKVTRGNNTVSAEDLLCEKVENITSDKVNVNAMNITYNIKQKRPKGKKEISLEQRIPKGKPKSGRVWKEQRKKSSLIIKTRGLRSTFEKKQKLREELKRSKELSRAIKVEKAAEKEAKKERRRENLNRAAENQRKSEIVQVITNVAKLKKIKRKHLRMIQKRDVLNL